MTEQKPIEVIPEMIGTLKTMQRTIAHNAMTAIRTTVKKDRDKAIDTIWSTALEMGRALAVIAPDVTEG